MENYQTNGVPKSFFGKGCPSQGFPSPSFLNPAVASSEGNIYIYHHHHHHPESNRSLAALAAQKSHRNRSDHSGRKRARSHSAADIAGLFASPATKKSQLLAILGYPQNRRKLAATTAASRRSRAISRPQRPQDTKNRSGKLWLHPHLR